MKVLVTGGTGVIGEAAITDLLKHGHEVRLLTRNATDDAKQWPDRVESWPASVCDQNDLKGCAEGCDLVLHVAGIVEESPPTLTFESVNVEGTRNVVREAERCKVGRFIFISSLGAEAGTSPYHRSKRRAEEVVRGFAGGWTILRPGNVYGPGDDVMSLLLTMVRTLPIVPVIGGGDDKFQPIWVEDLVAAISETVRRTDLHGRTLELAGEERTSINEILDSLSEITGRSPARIPIPSFIANAGITMASLLGAKLPISESQVTMLSEGNFIRTPGTNALTGVFHLKPTPLDSGLRKLADVQPEQTPDQGVGSLKRKRFWIDLSGSPLTAEELFARFRVRFGELTPFMMDLHAEPGTPTILDYGTTITMSLPVRGNVQVRVEKLTSNEAVLVTLGGHPLAGAIRFLSEQISDLIRFQVQVYDRPANLADWLAVRTLGEGMQAQTWESLLEAIVVESGARLVSPIQHEEEMLDDDKSARVEEWIKELVMERKRGEKAAATGTRKEADVAEVADQAPAGSSRKSSPFEENFGEDALA
ncbi:MAG TPA: NAD-dependent epimerase/dehydratase family protein [Gemmatimonadaceae bacterium]|nr:NAD-dependent epimerase/dehydratase family protein [Gemmatimonadaceae bacterium]